MKKKVHITLILLAVCQQLCFSQIFTTTTTSWTFTGFNGDDDNYTWSNITVPGTVLDAVTVTAHYFGDYTDISKQTYIYGYDNDYGVASATGSCLNAPELRTFVMPLNEVNDAFDDYGAIYLYVENSYSVISSTCTGISGVYFTLDIPYCANTIAGTAYPTITGVLPNTICSLDNALSLSATPSGGSFSGNYIVNSQFNPSGAWPGTYDIKYVYFDTVSGCNLYAHRSIKVKASPEVSNSNITACAASAFSISATGSNLVWYSDKNFTSKLDSTNLFTVNGLNKSTSYYVASKAPFETANFNFSVITHTGNNYFIKEIDNVTGDDRGGIAVTKNHVYVVGDEYTARFNLDLDEGLSLPSHDGLFVDLNTSDLFEIYTENPSKFRSYSFPQTIMGINKLNQDLNILSTTTLSSPIVITNSNNNAVFQGAGIVIIYTIGNNSWNLINLNTGNVVNLGTTTGISNYNSESWASWGIAEYDGTNYYANYRDDNSDDIIRKRLPDDLTTIVGSFDDFSDMASFTISPWNGKWYFHYESDAQFGGDEETVGYADASFMNTSFTGNYIFGCASEVNISVTPLTSIVTQPTSQTICGSNLAAITVSAVGANLGYLWNTGDATTSVSTSVAGAYMVTVSGTCSSVTSNTAQLTRLSACETITGINAAIDQDELRVYPNPSNGSFSIHNYLPSTADYQLIDLMGRTLASGSLKAGINQIDLAAKGVYYLKSGKSVKKVIIE